MCVEGKWPFEKFLEAFRYIQLSAKPNPALSRRYTQAPVFSALANINYIYLPGTTTTARNFIALRRQNGYRIWGTSGPEIISPAGRSLLQKILFHWECFFFILPFHSFFLLEIVSMDCLNNEKISHFRLCYS